ncbi:EF-hand calcium-binding domain-containing protein 13 [Phacochoerus africanus]|uniref:EF-hand calcium-binding domain-containing protein 13 n=1 Tax=Phacochoerus africanus TaxID=41426 RepID=UPI001FD96602|nr:EF-hand calcium-binding domain-containing protein 13 [Phacochoerus africanus]
METKVHFFCQGEENIDLSDDGYTSFATDLASRNIDSKKYIKLSKTKEKRITPEIRGLSTEHQKMYETSMFLFEEEKSSDFSGERKVKKKRSLQVQLHTKRTEIPSSSVKEKMTRKENSLCKLPSQYGVHKTLSHLGTSSSIIRKNETLSNLYQTLYEEIPQGHFGSQELSALQKACKIFGKIRNGRIYVNDLPMIHHILKISISDTEMRKALKTIDIDAFQNALKIFGRIKGGRVLTSEVDDVLDSMDILVIPETFQEVIKHIDIDSNQMVDIGDIVFTLNELQQQYEDVSIMEETALDETTSRKLSNVSGCYLPYRKKSSLSSRLCESSLSQKLNTKSLSNHEIMKENDDLEFKRLKSTLQIRKFQDEVDSSDIEFQEPCSKYGLNFKRSSEKAEIHDSKSKSQNLKSVTSFKKSLDKNDSFSISKLQKTAVRRHSTLLKQVSSKEKTAINSLGNVCKAIKKLQENYIGTEELQSILPSIGITLSDKEFKKIVTNTTRNENGMVKLDNFMSALSKQLSLPEYDVLIGAIKAIDKIKDENIDYRDLNTCLQNFGVYLSKPEFQKIIELTEAGETKKVNFKEFVDTMMSSTERFSEKLLLPDTIENLHNLSKEKMSVPDLWNTLSSLNSNLKKDEFLAAMRLSTVDESEKVQIEEFAKVVKDMRDASRLEELQEIILAVDLPEGDMIPEKDLEGFLSDTGIKSPKEEVEKILQSDFVSDDNTVNVKDRMKALRDTQKFSSFIALNETISTLDSVKESDQSDKDKYSDVLENTDKIYVVDDSLQERLNDSFVEEFKEAAHILSHVDNGKMGIPNLECTLKSLNIYLTEEDCSGTLRLCDISDNEEDLKDFLKEIKGSSHFKESIDK